VPELKFDRLSRHFRVGDTLVRALDEVSLRIEAGEFVAIMGQSGSGKSTLMNILGCLDRPTGGSYHIDGLDASACSGDELALLRRSTFGFVFQRYNLLPSATAAENVELPAVYAGLPRRQRRQRAQMLLTKLGLGDRLHHTPARLSGGQQQRVAIARALMNDPPVILADEPTGALDSVSGGEVMELLRELHREGRTVVIITHDEQVASAAERIIHLHDGRITQAAPGDAPGRAPTSPGRVRHAAGVLSEIGEAAKMALRALRANLFRTALTLFGMMIGVAAVITLVAAGSGSYAKVMAQVNAMGTDLLLVRPGAPGFRGDGDLVTMTPADAAAIGKLPLVSAVLPERSARETVRAGNVDYATTITGVWPSLSIVRDWRVAVGANIDEHDLLTHAPVALLGRSVVQRLFGAGENPVGHHVLIRNVPFEVIGIMDTKGASSWGVDQDDIVFIPLSTGLVRLFGGDHVNVITVKVRDLSRLDDAQAAVSSLLLARHRTDDFSIRNMTALLDMASTTRRTLTILLSIAAAISLIVGGVGVMNIMLMSVTERTREIGVRMATGARTRDIMLQFNTEAAVVCAIGGGIGVCLGLGAGFALLRLGVPIELSAMPAVFAFGSAFVTGILFGYLPARKAARLDPVAALAAE